MYISYFNFMMLSNQNVLYVPTIINFSFPKFTVPY